MSKHTPGPWYVIKSDGTDFTAISTKPQIEEDMYLDFEVLGSSEWLRVKPDDLTLMAAAPELLEALKFSLSEWVQYDGANDPKGPTEKARIKAMRMAKAAIAKAEGKRG